MKKLKKLKPKRDGLWQLIRHFKTFTITDLKGYSDMERSSIQTYIRQLEKGGYLKKDKSQKLNSSRFKSYQYTLMKDNGHHRPELTFNGDIKHTSNSQKIWSAIKILKRFDYRDVALTTQVNASYARSYLRLLKLASYIVVIQEASFERPEKYLFKPSNDTGFKAPQIKRNKDVYDQNIHKVVYTSARGVS